MSEGLHCGALMSVRLIVQAPKQAFAGTGHTLRLMEAMAAAVQQREPLLLVGETGTGKTTIVQQLAAHVSASDKVCICSMLFCQHKIQR